MKAIKKFLICILVLALVFQTSVFADNKVITPSEESKFFEMVAGDLVDIYHFDLEKDELLTRTIRTMINENPQMLDTFLRAMFDSLDDYSEFYSPEEYAAVTKYFENVTGGIGVTVNKTGNYVVVVNVLESGSAKAAGMLSGDRIFAVDGEEMFAKPMDYVTSKMKGEIGTQVNVTVLRGEEKIDYTLTRVELKLDTVYPTVLTDKLGYVSLTQFASSTDAEFEEALKLFDENGVTDVIIDLRNNTGGYINSAVNIAKMIVPEGTIITHKMKYNDITTVYTSELKEKKYNIVTLVNEYTASAAEILASALQESGASVLVGEQTYGKAVTQNIMGLYSGRACKITTGEYITRNGNSINKVGIIPDYNVENVQVPLRESTVEKFVYSGAGYSKGSKGVGISGINQRLSLLGYSVDANDEYSEDTEYAVKSFQEYIGIEQTGICDIMTQIYLVNEADSKEIYLDLQLAEALKILESEYKIYTLKE